MKGKPSSKTGRLTGFPQRPEFRETLNQTLISGQQQKTSKHTSMKNLDMFEPREVRKLKRTSKSDWCHLFGAIFLEAMGRGSIRSFWVGAPWGSGSPAPRRCGSEPQAPLGPDASTGGLDARRNLVDGFDGRRVEGSQRESPRGGPLQAKKGAQTTSPC